MIAFARNLVRHAGEEVVDERTRQTNRLEIIAATIAGDDRNAHFGHDLQQALVDGRAVIFDRLRQAKIPKQAAAVAVGNDSFGQIGVHRCCADADKYGEIMRVQAFRGSHIDGRVTAQAIADQVRMHSSSSEDHRDTNAVSADIFVGQKEFGFAHTHGCNGFFADAGDGGAQTFLPCGDVICAVNFGTKRTERGLEPAPITCGQNRAVEHQHVSILALFLQDIRKVRKARFQAHNMPLTQGIDRWVGNLAKILAKELTDKPRLVADHSKRRVVAHRADGFLAIFDHRREDHFDIFQRHASGNLTLSEFSARPGWRAVVACRWQVFNPAEAAYQRAIILLGRNAVLQLTVAIQFAFVQVDGNHLARAQAAFFQYGGLGQDNHSGFRADHEQIVRGKAIAQRT